MHTKFVESQCAHGNYCFTSEYILLLKEYVSVSHPILGEDAAEQYDDLLSSSSSPSQKQGHIFVVYFTEDNHPCSIACNHEIDGRNDTIHITYPISNVGVCDQ